MSDLGGTPLSPGCALLVASRGALNLKEISVLAGVSLEDIRQIEERALRRKLLTPLVDYADGADPLRRIPTLEERLARALRIGSATTVELAAALGAALDSVWGALCRMLEAGTVTRAKIGREYEWTLVEPQKAAVSAATR